MDDLESLAFARDKLLYSRSVLIEYIIHPSESGIVLTRLTEPSRVDQSSNATVPPFPPALSPFELPPACARHAPLAPPVQDQRHHDPMGAASRVHQLSPRRSLDSAPLPLDASFQRFEGPWRGDQGGDAEEDV